MDITPYAEAFREDLARAAEAFGPEATATTERLAVALDPSFRMVALDLLTEAAAEISAELPAGSVEVRLRSRRAEFVVDVPPGPSAADLAAVARDVTMVSGVAYDATAATPNDVDEDAGEPSVESDDAAQARITLRLPESLKRRAEEAAAADGSSLNAWLVRAVRDAADQPARGHRGGPTDGLDLEDLIGRLVQSSVPRPPRPPRAPRPPRGDSLRGWI